MGKSDNESNRLNYQGTVLWFREDLGFGFIECEHFTELIGSVSKPKGIFAHYSRIMTDEKFKTLAKGQIVDFYVVQTIKGLMAVNIRESVVPFLRSQVVNENTVAQ